MLGSIAPGKTGRPGALGAGLLRRQAQDGAQGRPRRLGQHGRSERIAAHAAADVLPADVRQPSGRRCKRPASRSSPRSPMTCKVHEKYGLGRIVEPVSGTRVLTKQHMVRNDLLPEHRRQPADLRGDGRRRSRHRHPAENDLAQPALFLQLKRRSAEMWTAEMSWPSGHN